jgi:TPR repeat protein
MGAYLIAEAAKKELVEAFYTLGIIYEEGVGVPTDYLKSHMWFSLATRAGNEASAKSTDIVASKMTSQQIEQAQRMARECIASNFKRCD